MSVFRKIGVFSAIAAFPGLLGGQLTAQTRDNTGAILSPRLAVSAPATRAAVPVANPVAVARNIRQPGRLDRSAFPAQPAAGPAALFVRPSVSFIAPAVRKSANSDSAELALWAFDLDDADTLIAPGTSTPLVRGSFDRLASGYTGFPPVTDQAAGSARGQRLGEPQPAPAPLAQNAQVSAVRRSVTAPDAVPQQDRALAPQTVLAKADAVPARTRRINASAALAAAVPVNPVPQRIGSPSPASLPTIAPPPELAAQQQQNLDLRPGTQTFPAEKPQPAFTIDDELILQLKIKGFDATDTVVAYGTREAVYLPVGEIARILDLAIRVSDDGNYANGWFLDETRSLTINLREQILITPAGERPLKPGEAQAFDGEMFLRSELFEEIFPLELKPNLRVQAIYLATLIPFPFEERMRRETERAQLGAREGKPDQAAWPRLETPWLAASMPLADLELRAVSDSPMGSRLEGDLRLGGDLAFMTAGTYFSASTRDGLVASLIQLGRRDAEGNLLGPLDATDFQFGDVATSSMPLGLRGQAGRGAFITNRPFQNASVFEQIDLRGILPNGYEVELYRNDILVGSIASAANDQYEFLEVPVDYGLNVFRLVFYGPQGQRREEIRRVTVGDGRLATGQFEYDVGVVQRGENLLAVRGPNFNPIEGFGSWQAAARLSYGLNSKVTAVTSLAYFEEDDGALSVATAGLRTGFGALAFRADAAAREPMGARQSGPGSAAA